MITLSAEEARARLLVATGLGRPRAAAGPAGVRALLTDLTAIQLDPLAPIGANADLVAMARTDAAEGDLFAAVYPGHAFEHFAKERCLLPAAAFPYYRDRARETPWWRQTERLRRLPAGLVDEVLAEVQARGPIAVSALSGRGAVTPIDWSGWKGTARAATLAVEVLWLQCRVVVCGRAGRGKVVDVPERALPDVAHAPAGGPFAAWALRERARAMGMLPAAAGPWWGQLRDERSTLPRALADAGELVEIGLPGTRRRWWALPSFLELPPPDLDDTMRVLGPLDPLLWDRELVRRLFGVDYVWEVYKPAAERRWGWYVCPLLHRGRIVGRFEGRRGPGGVEVLGVWPEAGFEEGVFRRAVGEHGGRLR